MKKRCLWSTVHKAVDSYTKDLTVTKSRMINENGEEIPVFEMHENKKRPFWITKKGYRNHEQYREIESIENCNEYLTNESQLLNVADSKLNDRPVFNGYIDRDVLQESPYLYGTDIPVTSYAKYEINKDCDEDYNPLAKVGVIDYETDVVNKDPAEQSPIIGAFSADKVWELTVDLNWYGKSEEVAEKEILAAIDTHLKEVKEKRQPNIKIKFVYGEANVVKSAIASAHNADIDILTAWNAKFDIETSIKALERNGIYPGDVFCNPNVPEKYRSFNWYPGQEFREKENGKMMTVPEKERWGTLTAAATFYWVCGMVHYNVTRKAKGTQKVGLDAVAKRELGLGEGKLKIPEVENLTGLDYHVKMQTDYKAEYCAYAIYDCVLVELIDEVTRDLRFNLLSRIRYAPLRKFTSNPTTLSVNMHMREYARGRTLGSVSKKNMNKIDRCVIGVNDWIVTLASERFIGKGNMVVRIGGKVIETDTNVYYHCKDNDVSQGYPTIGYITNLSHSTTRIEVFKIEGLGEYTQREIGINMTSIGSNSVSLAHHLYRLPTIKEALEIL